MNRLKIGLEKILILFSTGLLLSLVFIVVAAVIFRKMGHSLIWYDELASVILVWLTYTGSAVAASQRAHLGFEGLVKRFRFPYRMLLFIMSEAAIIGFFIIVAIYGFRIQASLQGESLISLPWFPLWLTQGIIPVSAILFISAEILSIPQALRKIS